MKKMKQRIAVLLTCAMTFSSVLPGYAASWQNADGIWYYNHDDGSQATGWLQISPQEWYYLDNSGQMQTGWHQDADGSRYYLSTASQGVEGQMKYGWYQDSDGVWYFLNTVHDGTFGRALNAGWQWIDGYCYYFGADGKMAAGGMTSDGYTVNADGQWTENGVAQYVPGKGIITKKAPASSESHRSSGSSSGNSSSSGGSSSSGSSTGGSGSGSGSSTGGNSGSGTGGNTGGTDDKYKVYEESNKDTFETNENVKTFAVKTTEDKEILKNLADGILDYWVEAETPEIESESGGTAEFQVTQRVNLAIEETSPLYKYITEEKIKENDVLVIPSCEYFPTGLSLVYQSDDDSYTGTRLEGVYDAGQYQVIHAMEASVGDILAEDISYHAGGVNESEPVQFIWTPTVSGDELQEIMLWQPQALAQASAANAVRETDIEANAVAAEESGDAADSANEPRGKIAATPADAAREDGDGTTGFSNPAIMTMAARSPRANSPADAFSFSQTKGSKGTNLLFTANSIVLYDADGNKDTKNDQIVLDGKIGLENVNPEFGVEYDIANDVLPKQIKAVVDYDQVMGLTVTGQESVSMADFMSKIRKAMSMPENKYDYFIAELQGIDWDNTVVLASVGVNLGLNQVQIGMRDIQNATAWNPLNTMIVFMVLMDFEGNISVKTVLDAEYRDVTKTGINIQQQDFNGGYGTADENKGDYNTTVSVAGTEYAVNIYNQHNTTLSLSMSTEGHAYMDTGVGIGAGIMCMGIMPAMVKGTIGLEGSLEGGGEASWNNNDGVKWQVEGAAKLRGYLKAKALIKLKAKYWWFGDQEKTLEKEFDLADVTLMEESWSGQEQSKQELSYDASWKKYLEYTEEQLAKEFHEFSYDYEAPNASHRSKKYIYYDGIEELPLVKNTYTMYGTDRVEYNVKYDETDPSNQFVIERSVYGDWDGNQWIETRYTKIHMRVKDMIIGITDTTTLDDLSSIGAASVVYDFNLGSYDIYFTPEDMSDEYFEVDIDVLKNLDYEVLRQIVREGTPPYLGLSKQLTDYCKDKLLNPEAYAELH